MSERDPTTRLLDEWYEGAMRITDNRPARLIDALRSALETFEAIRSADISEALNDECDSVLRDIAKILGVEEE